MTIVDNWVIYDLGDNKYVKTLNFEDGIGVTIASKNQNNKFITIYYVQKSQQLHLVFNDKVQYAVPGQNQLSHLMHLGDMILTDEFWEQKFGEPDYIDEFNLVPVEKESTPGLYNYQSDPEDPLEYRFGEPVCNVLSRWSKELMDMRADIRKNGNSTSQLDILHTPLNR